MDRHAAGGGELLVANVALEVLRLLVLDQDLLVVELAVAVIAPHLRRSLLLLPHWLSVAWIRVRVSRSRRREERGDGLN